MTTPDPPRPLPPLPDPFSPPAPRPTPAPAPAPRPVPDPTPDPDVPPTPPDSGIVGGPKGSRPAGEAVMRPGDATWQELRAALTRGRDAAARAGGRARRRGRGAGTAPHASRPQRGSHHASGDPCGRPGAMGARRRR
jgi:hypothetical protein